MMVEAPANSAAWPLSSRITDGGRITLLVVVDHGGEIC